MDTNFDTKLRFVASKVIVREGTVFLHDFFDQISRLAATEYTAERERTLRKTTHARETAVRDALSGTRPSRPIHGYEIQGTHTGLVASGPDADAIVTSLCQKTLGEILAIAYNDSVWIWVATDAVTILAALATQQADELRLGIGRTTTGLAGFRTTNRQAVAAHRFATTLARTIIRFEDIALEDLAGRDTAIADHFVRDELGPLLTAGSRGQTLMDTLRSYLDHGQNGTATAADIGVTQRAISHRLADIEQILGTPIRRRSAELQTALRLHNLVTHTRRDEERLHTDGIPLP